MRALLAATALTLLSAWTSAPTPVDEQKKTHWTYCAFFPDPNHKESYCTTAPLSQAQEECNASLKRREIEGTCECTDDQEFIGDRCG